MPAHRLRGRRLRVRTAPRDAPPDVALPAPSSVTLSQTQTLMPAANTVASYLREHSDGGPWKAGPAFTWTDDPGLALFREPPIVRITADSSPFFQATARRVVDALNAWLPYDKHLALGEDADTLSLVEEIPTGELWMGESNMGRSGARPGAAAQVDLDIDRTFDQVQQRWEKQALRATRVMVNPASPEYQDESLYSTLVHEALHALGLNGHVDMADYPGSVMHYAYLLTVEDVPTSDGVAILAAYTRLVSGTEPESLDAASLGTWSRNVAGLQGTLDACDCTFGTNWVNGVAVPWVDGAVTTGTFADSGLRGTVTWEGHVVGWTPAEVTVSGDTALAVNLASLTGTADFTNLAVHETQTVWGDGDLGYGLSLNGNYFRSTAGADPGYVSGRFVGQRHDGALGLLEHPDLTGAFGAVR